MINFDFIGKLEGRSLVGYVPAPDGGVIESGVTIASGFDIGQRSMFDLESLPFVLMARFLPYAGLTGHEAKAALDNMPLKISESECAYINQFAHKEAVEALLSDWRKATNMPFAALADECQTVVASVAFQYGDLPTRTPNFWRQVTTGDWWGALANLRAFGDRFPTRRNKEADLLERRLCNELNS